MNENNNNIGKCSSASGKVKLESKHRQGRFSFLFITPFRRSRQTKTVANDCPNHHHHELEFPSDGEAVGNTALCQSNADIKTKPASQTRNEMKDKLVVHRLTVSLSVVFLHVRQYCNHRFHRLLIDEQMKMYMQTMPPVCQKLTSC